MFKIFNGPMPTTAAQVAVTTGTGIKTMLQVKSVTGVPITVKAWGVSMDGSAAAAGIQWELLDTDAIFATVTAHVAAGIVLWDGKAIGRTSTETFTVGATETGYTASGEGSITTVKMLDSQFVQPTGAYAWEFSLGNEPVIQPEKCLRIRCKAAVAVNALCWMLLEV